MPNPRDVVRLDPLLEENRAFDFQRDQLSPADWRANTKLIIAGGLAGILWLMIIGVIGWQCWRLTRFSDALIAEGTNEAKIARIDKASASTNETAKSLYTFLTPLATAVTTYQQFSF